ncbi:MAG: alpha/beta hydrolase [Gemmatimonadaceae bacterium]|nr:alpha/beta hydrolase [Gemmatimonadaceae bacterium]
MLAPPHRVIVDSIDAPIGIAVRTSRAGRPPLLLLHGHPQTSAIWHRVWDRLAERFTLVAPDLRGYGASDKPAGRPDHTNYSKRTMAHDQVALMRQLGYERWSVVGHDRGGRVAHRLTADHPQCVDRLAVLDIAPTLAMYEQTDERFARTYWHWFFLIQPAPLPERLIGNDGAFYARSILAGRHAALAPFAPEALAEYERCASDPATIHGFCEDYRAAATIDLEHDRADRDTAARLTAPLLALWGAHGWVGRGYDVLAEWRRVAAKVHGAALDCGHYLPEEAPQALCDALLPFLTGEE